MFCIDLKLFFLSQKTKKLYLSSTFIAFFYNFPFNLMQFNLLCIFIASPCIVALIWFDTIFALIKLINELSHLNHFYIESIGHSLVTSRTLIRGHSLLLFLYVVLTLYWDNDDDATCGVIFVFETGINIAFSNNRNKS